MRRFIWTMCLISASPSLGSGNSSGSGGDREEIARSSAWFLNQIDGADREITYCSEGGGAVERATVTQALAHWDQYLYAKGVNEEGFHQFGHRFVGRDICSGSEDLTFFFGTLNDRTRPVIERHYQPVGIAYKETYDYPTHWSRGFVWIAPNRHYTDMTLPVADQQFPAWDQANRLLATLLHEIGHIYGMGHVEDTIMRPDVWKLTLASRLPEMGFKEIYRERIDHLAELMHQRMAGSEDPADYELSYIHHGMWQLFRDLTGRDPLGELRAELQLYKLSVRDNLSAYEFDLRFMTNRTHVTRDGLFKQSWSEGSYNSESFMSKTWYGTLTFGTRSVPLIYEYNSGADPITLSTNRGGHLESLVSFRSKY